MHAHAWVETRQRIASRPPPAFPDCPAPDEARPAAPLPARVHTPYATRLTAASTCEHHVKKASSNRILGTLLLPALLLAGCGTPAAKDFGGRWKPVNRFQSSTTEIPLNRPYTYYAAPMDETLRNMLVRWTTDTGMTLVYRIPSDYTLFAPVTKVRTADVRQAATELSEIYAAQGVSVTVAGGRLQVDRVKTLGSAIAPRSTSRASPASSATARPASPDAAGGVR